MVILIVVTFALGYVIIVLEHPLRLNQSATALLTGVLCWSVAALLGYLAGAACYLVARSLGRFGAT